MEKFQEILLENGMIINVISRNTSLNLLKTYTSYT